MAYQDLRQIRPLYFGYEEVAAALNIAPQSAQVLVSRYCSKGLLVRLKRNHYILREKWDYMDELEAMRIANILQVPSYLSLTTALSFYEITTQMQQGFIESIALHRSYEKAIEGKVFIYRKVDSKYYFGFEKKERTFIASPEKALADGLYLTAFGKYSLDFAALDISKINQANMAQLLEQYPERVNRLWMRRAIP